MHVAGTGSALRSAVICFCLGNESASFLRNASHPGLPVPEKLNEVLSQLHNKHEKEK
ncbi:MAG: phage holin family protein [Clostridiales bacterium]|nr:phage holin family protein [Clostridiales bacterium]